MDQFRKSFSRLAVAVSAGAFLLVLASCGGNNSSSNNTPTVSMFPKRILVENALPGANSAVTYIFNATNDLVWQVPIPVAAGTNMLVLSPDKKTTIASNGVLVYFIDNAQEGLSGNPISLTANSESIAWLGDNKTAVATARNATVTNQSALGAVYILDVTNRTVSATIGVPEARSLVTNRAGTKVLAFADDTDSVFLIDTTAKTATPLAGFDRPVSAVFSTDDSRAYVLNCGPECGGAAASVQILNMSDNSLGAKIPVSAATTALLDNSKLYVAGTAGSSGLLDVIDTGSNTRTQMGIAIADGYHNLMALADNSRLYIGAKNCSVNGTASTGCLSIYNTGGTTAVIPKTNSPGTVTGIQPVLGRNLVYVTMGGELIIFDTSTDAPRVGNQFDVVGNATAVQLID